MIDLAKERQLFEDRISNDGFVEFSNYSFEKDGSGDYVDERVECAWFSYLQAHNTQQQTIESLKAQLSKKQEALKFADSCFIELREALESSKAQLAQYQGDDCVVVKKDNKTIVAIEKTVESQLQASGITQDPFRLDGEKILNAMIETAEKRGLTL